MNKETLIKYTILYSVVALSFFCCTDKKKMTVVHYPLRKDTIFNRNSLTKDDISDLQKGDSDLVKIKKLAR